MAQTDRISIRQDIAVLPYLIPFLLVFVIFIGYPVFYSFWISLHRVTIYTDFYNTFGDMEWVGFANYTQIYGDAVFWWSIILTFFYAALVIFFGLVVSLVLALSLQKAKRGFSLMRTGFFLPNVFDIFVVSVIWLLLYSPRSGLIAILLSSVGADELAATGVMNNPWLTIPSIAAAIVLKNAGFGMVLFLVSLSNIPESIFEAADVDGASYMQRLWHVTLPLLKPIILFLIITGMVASLNSFAEIFGMTNATGGSSVQPFGEEGPTLQSARIAAFHLYMKFNEASYGEAAAISFVLLAIAMVVSWINFKLLATDH